MLIGFLKMYNINIFNTISEGVENNIFYILKYKIFYVIFDD